MRRIVLLLSVISVALVACGPTIGDPCIAANQCGNGVCLTADFAPGGLCSLACSATTGCPNGSACIANALGPGAAGCMRSCTTVNECRTGYLCQADTTTSASYCVGPKGL